ncbi:MAG TPA: hypothetical protein IAB04_01610 [Candidatus Avimonoglobus intestinipullorum]|uniref:Uncharacterized protein n=1 Tax=Candidatus Avimonoglobus intestinipullorum TaxID=2840699 RepID=A0A9D1LU47_9FIRM|nr:hypothetical protein [Candidatus Avimonoglobus intestinipullorum]
MKTYIKPDFTVRAFDVADVITVSGDPEDVLTGATVEGETATWNGEWDAYLID